MGGAFAHIHSPAPLSVRLNSRGRRISLPRVKSLTAAVNIVSGKTPIQANVDDEVNPSTIFQFSYEFMRKLFCPSDHPTVAVASSLEDVISIGSQYDDKKVIIIVEPSIPSYFGNNDSVTPG